MKRVLTMFAVSAAAVAACATAGWAQNPQAIISWGTTCPTQVTNAVQGAATTYTLWVGIKNCTAADANVATDFNVFFGPGGPGTGAPSFPDAWRFDDTGCQTAAGVTLNSNANNKACPAFKGTNPLAITAFQLFPTDNKMNIRLANTYDTFTPTAGATYTAWNLIFDHTFSVVGPGTPGLTCGGAEVPLCFGISTVAEDDFFRSFLLTIGNVEENFTFATPAEQFVTWNGGPAGGCPGNSGVRTETSTWGKIKGMYR